MDIEVEDIPEPIKVTIFYGSCETARLLSSRFLNGQVFGENQRITLCLHSIDCCNERALALKIRIEQCAYKMLHDLIVTENTVAAAENCDVAIVCTNLLNLNILDFSPTDICTMPKEFLNPFRNLVQISKAIESYSILVKIQEDEEERKKYEESRVIEDVDENRIEEITNLIPKRKLTYPIVIADGFVSATLLAYRVKSLPRKNITFVTVLNVVAKHTLADTLKVTCGQLNDILIWSGDNLKCYVEVIEPLIEFDLESKNYPHCRSRLIDEAILESKKIDRSQFNEAWIKTKYLEKILEVVKTYKNSPISFSNMIANHAKVVWGNADPNHTYNIGALSDGSYGVPIGYPFVFPVTVKEKPWRINKSFEKNLYARFVLKRMASKPSEIIERVIIICETHFLVDVAEPDATG